MYDKEMLDNFSRDYAQKCRVTDQISAELFDANGVLRGLRDKNGNGVVAGLTNISKIESFRMENGQKIPCDGNLWYRGYNVIDLVKGFEGKRYGFEEVTYLLLFGELPSPAQLKTFCSLGHIDHDLTGHLVQLVIGRHRIERGDLLLVLGGKILNDLVHGLAGNGDLGSCGALVLVDRHVADLVVKALEIALGILLGIDAQLLELVARGLFQAGEEIVSAILNLIKLSRKVLGDELLDRRASAAGKQDHARNQDGHEGRKQQLLFHVVPPNERHRASRTRRTL